MVTGRPRLVEPVGEEGCPAGAQPVESAAVAPPEGGFHVRDRPRCSTRDRTGDEDCDLPASHATSSGIEGHGLEADLALGFGNEPDQTRHPDQVVVRNGCVDELSGCEVCHRPLESQVVRSSAATFPESDGRLSSQEQ